MKAPAVVGARPQGIGAASVSGRVRCAGAVTDSRGGQQEALFRGAPGVSRGDGAERIGSVRHGSSQRPRPTSERVVRGTIRTVAESAPPTAASPYRDKGSVGRIVDFLIQG